MKLATKISGTVPNGSEVDEATTDAVIAGRIPLKTDEQLLAVAKKLNEQLGRVPKTQELVDLAGGCQRQRAVRTLQALRIELAESAVRSQLLIPAVLQDELKTLFARWLDCAATQLAEKHAEAEQKLERRLDAANDTLMEKADRLDELQARFTALQQIQHSEASCAEQVQSQLAQLTQQRDEALAVAAERQRILYAVIGKRSDTPAIALPQ